MYNTVYMVFDIGKSTTLVIHQCAFSRVRAYYCVTNLKDNKW